MNLQGSHYDPELQMFTEPPRDPEPARLQFLRWLCELGQLEHEPAGAPAGCYAAAIPEYLPERRVRRPRPRSLFLSATR